MARLFSPAVVVLLAGRQPARVVLLVWQKNPSPFYSHFLSEIRITVVFSEMDPLFF